MEKSIPPNAAAVIDVAGDELTARNASGMKDCTYTSGFHAVVSVVDMVVLALSTLDSVMAAGQIWLSASASSRSKGPVAFLAGEMGAGVSLGKGLVLDFEAVAKVGHSPCCGNTIFSSERKDDGISSGLGFLMCTIEGLGTLKIAGLGVVGFQPAFVAFDLVPELITGTLPEV